MYLLKQITVFAFAVLLTSGLFASDYVLTDSIPTDTIIFGNSAGPLDSLSASVAYVDFQDSLTNANITHPPTDLSLNGNTLESSTGQDVDLTPILGSGDNMATTDLTLTADRAHDLNGDKLEFFGPDPQLWIRHTTSGDNPPSALSGGLHFQSSTGLSGRHIGGMFAHTGDPQLTTENPKYGGYVSFRNTQDFDDDSDTGVGIVFGVTDEDAGATASVFRAGMFDHNGNFGIGYDIANPEEKLTVQGGDIGMFSYGAATSSVSFPTIIGQSDHNTVVANDTIFVIEARARDNLIRSAAFIRFIARTTFGSNPLDAPTDTKFYNQSDGTGENALLTPTFVISSEGNIGIGVDDPTTLIEASGSSPIFDMHNEALSGQYLRLGQIAGTSRMELVTPIGQKSLMRFSPKPLDGTSSAQLDIFRETSTTGSVENRYFPGDGSASIVHKIGGNISTYFNDYDPSDNMRFGLGTNVPDHELHVHRWGSGFETYIKVSNDDTGEASSDGMLMGYDDSEVATFNNRENTDMIFSTNDTEAVRISNDQKVGIGQSDPLAKLHILGTANGTDAIVRIGSNQAAQANGLVGILDFYNETSPTPQHLARIHTIRETNNDGAIAFSTQQGADVGVTEHMRIKPDGDVGIGTTTPSRKLDVDGDAVFTPDDNLNFSITTTAVQGRIFAENTTPTAGDLIIWGNLFAGVRDTEIRSDYNSATDVDLEIRNSSANGHLAFRTNSTEQMVIESDGSLQLNDYGSGNNTGTAAKWLAVDASGNLIEEDAPTGGSDDQTVDKFQLTGTTLELSLEDDGQPDYTADLSSLQDGTGTDDQNLIISGDQISIEGGTGSMDISDVMVKPIPFTLFGLTQDIVDGVTEAQMLIPSQISGAVCDQLYYKVLDYTSGNFDLDIQENGTDVGTHRDVTSGTYGLFNHTDITLNTGDVLSFRISNAGSFVGKGLLVTLECE